MKKQTAFLNYSLIVLIVALVVALNIVAAIFSGMITQALCGFGIDYNSPASQEAQQNGAVVSKELCEEGFTLLKNKDETLPLKDNKVNVFGWGASDNGFIYQGGGSGEGSTGGRISFYQGLKNSGLQINDGLAASYNSLSWRRSGFNDDVSNNYRVFDAPKSFYTEQRMNQAKEFSDIAIVVLSRRGAEGTDLPHVQYDQNGNADQTRKYSAISPDEEYMIKKVTENFNNVIVVMNTADPMECGFLNNDKIGAALIMYLPGNKGTPALGDLLLGVNEPSGKTVDTFAYDLSTAATYNNAGSEGVHWPKGKNNRTCTYCDYSENIYIGYYWYETADKAGYWNEVDNQYGKGYNGVVQYPFGYGLSYAKFKWTVESVSVPNNSILNANSEIQFNLFVENISKDYSGKDVIELYYSAPYYENGIEKSAIKLAAFDKTAELKPGEGQKIKLSVKLSDMASYDCYDKNNNGFMGYEVEQGTYTLSLRTDVHTLANLSNAGNDAEYNYIVPNGGFKYEKDIKTGVKVENQFTNYTNPVSNASSTINEPAISASSKAYSCDGLDIPNSNISYMSRKNFKETLPNFADDIKITDSFYKETWLVNSPKINPDDVMPITDSKETNYTLNDFIYQDENGNYQMVPYEDERWDKLINQLSVKQMGTLIAHGGFTTDEIPSINKPMCVDKDGPSGFNAIITGGKENEYCTNYPCETIIASTWSWKMAYQFGLSIGKEGSAAGINGWYGPGANTHRSPLGGRNFEYYSEDPYLSGIMCAYSVKGAKENGVYAYIKHFAVNDNDTGRNGEYKWLTEQALREIYLKPFEMAVKIGGANGMMGSVDRIGSVRATGSYALMTQVLRNEWGFRGTVITDYYQSGNVNDADEGIRAGNNLMLNPSANYTMFDDYKSATAVKAMHEGAKGVLYTYLDTRYTSMTSLGLDLSTVIGKRSAVFPWWTIILGVFDFLVVAGGGVWAVVIFKKSKKAEA